MAHRGGQSWRAAMTDALYGPAGFYRGESVPARHFRTSAHLILAWAATIGALARRVDDQLGQPEGFAVVDVGAGGGELLTALASTAPARWSLTGVDLAPRPIALPERVSWSETAPDGTTGLVLANELLDVVPVDVVERTDDGLRYVEVMPDGAEQLGEPVCERDAEWLRRWWPLADVGARAEVGWPRDDLWHSLKGSLVEGTLVAIDYAVDPARDHRGTLTAYRHGRAVAPVPDGTCDLTAHVHVEALVSPGDVVISQRDALDRLGLAPVRPAYGGDSAAYLSALAGDSELAELRDPSGLGAFTWLVHPVGITNPLAEPDEMCV